MPWILAGCSRSLTGCSWAAPGVARQQDLALRMSDPLTNFFRSKRDVAAGDRLVEIKKPLGLILEEDEKGNVYVASITPGGNAARTKKVRRRSPQRWRALGHLVAAWEEAIIPRQRRLTGCLGCPGERGRSSDHVLGHLRGRNVVHAWLGLICRSVRGREGRDQDDDEGNGDTMIRQVRQGDSVRLILEGAEGEKKVQKTKKQIEESKKAAEEAQKRRDALLEELEATDEALRAKKPFFGLF
eukprot:scaffold1878_cov258-Pinguiococcus_pyrenoidosus.AAC.28